MIRFMSEANSGAMISSARHCSGRPLDFLQLPQRVPRPTIHEKSIIMANAMPEPSGHAASNRKARDLDRAFWYVQESSVGNDAYPIPASDSKALRRKIDWHIIPIMFCCYTMQFIDKVLLNVRCSIID